MRIFDQRGQNVDYQYNAAGNINIDNLNNREYFTKKIDEIQDGLLKAKDAKTIDSEVFTDIDYQLTKITQTFEKGKTDRKTITKHLTKAKSLLEGATALGGLTIALDKLISLASTLF